MDDNAPSNERPVRDEVYVTAAEWIETLAEQPLDKVTERRFLNWLKEDPEHRAVFNRMVGTWEDSALDEASDATLAKAPLLDKPLPSRANRHRSLWAGAFSAAAVVVVGVMAVFGAMLADPDTSHGANTVTTIETPPANLREMTLADGSHLEVDGDSALQLNMNEARREVTLERGAAYFTVASDKQRPFEVTINTTKVVAVGTEFDINRTAKSVDVTVYEGAIEVTTARRPSPTLLRAGERVRISGGDFASVEQVDLHRLVDWRSGWIEVSDESLAYLLERLSRHSSRPIEIADAELEDLRVAGRFRLQDTRGTLALLTELYPLKTQDRPGRILVLAAP